VLLVVGHLSAQLVSTMATDSFFETLFFVWGKRWALDGAIMAYLMLPEVRRLFVPA
jgi:hypothetical protein